MSDRQSLSAFLKVSYDELDAKLDEERVRLLRKDLPCEITDEHLQKTADQFNLCEDQENHDLLLCCLSESDETVIDALKERFREKQSSSELLAITTRPTSNNAPQSMVLPNAASTNAPETTKIVPVEELQAIVCKVQKLVSHSYIDDFIKEFLWQKITPDAHKSTAPDDGITIIDLFVRKTLAARDVFEWPNEFKLIEPESFIDAFDTDTFDHFRGLLELRIKPIDGRLEFPTKWRLKDDVDIQYRIEQNTPATLELRDNQKKEAAKFPSSAPTSSSVKERTLSGFLGQIHRSTKSKEPLTKWEKDLRRYGIFEYEDLERLEEQDWSRIKSPSLMTCKLIKMHLERQRHTATKDTSNHGETMTDCEVLANLHMIKLYMLNKLAEHYGQKNLPKLPKLEAKCVNMAFEEMRKDMEDDGLFCKMAEFFHPLTIREDELVISKQDMIKVIEDQQKQEEHLTKDLAGLKNKYEEQKNKCGKHQTMIEDMVTKRSQVKEQFKKKKSRVHHVLIPELETEWVAEDSHLREELLALERTQAKEDAALKKIEAECSVKQELFDSMKKDMEVPEEERGKIDHRLCKPHRGFIMYGPPGTGKSQIMKELAKRIGIAMLGPPLAAGELDRPLVGQSEKVILDLCTRGHRLSHLMCCVCIDEIDALAPRRDEDSSEGAVARISVLLSVLEGIKDVPNLMFFSATNRLHMMDEAFLRRMTGKFFVGRPTYGARKRILEKIPSTILTPAIRDDLAQATTNFSGAALVALNKAITVHHINARRDKSKVPFQFDLREALEKAHTIATQYQLFIGGQDTLPQLMINNLNKNDKYREYFHLKSRVRYTGKMIVSLTDQRAYIEMGVLETTLDEIELSAHERSLASLLERLSNYGNNRNVQLLQLIDLSLLASRGAYDERKILETLKERYDEHMQYDRSMIVYDLDSLIGVNRSETNSSMGPSHNCSIVNLSIYNQVVARFRTAQVDSVREKWAVAVVRDAFLLKSFSDDVDFPRTKKKQQEDDEENRKETVELRCWKCDTIYVESENKMGACEHHDGFVYDNFMPNLPQYTLREAYATLLSEESEDPEVVGDTDDVNEDDSSFTVKEKLERAKGRFRFACCNAQVQIGTRGGCKKGKHGGKLAKDLKTWENSCMRNQEALRRWKELMTGRQNRAFPMDQIFLS